MVIIAEDNLPHDPSRSIVVKNEGDNTKILMEQPRKFSNDQLTAQERSSDKELDHIKKSGRLRVDHTYHDHCQGHKLGGCGKILSWGEETNAEPQNHGEGLQGGVVATFPMKLHLMLDCAKEHSFDHIVSWMPHGRSFRVHQPKQFVAVVMPKWFKQSKFTSFQRQLNLYGFARLTRGPDRGGYYHELFLRGHVQLSLRMIRTCVKGTGVKAAASPSTEPNFYKMEPCECRSDAFKEQEVPDYSLGRSMDPCECTSAEFNQDEVLDVSLSHENDISLTDATMCFWMIPLDPEELLISLESSTAAPKSNNKSCNHTCNTRTRSSERSGSRRLTNFAVVDVVATNAEKCPVPRPPLLDEPCDDLMFENHHFHYLNPDAFGW